MSRWLFLVYLALSMPGLALAEKGKSMDGTWLPTDAELAGEKFPEEIRKTLKLVIKDNNYTVSVDEKLDKGTVKLNPSTKPKEMDIIGVEGPNKGKTFLAIYEIDGDTLKVCYDLGGTKRPVEFKTSKESPTLFLVTYKRQKP